MNICPTCKTSIPENSPGGFCPACILRDADELPPVGRTAPSLDEVRAAFPQLEVLELIGQGGMGFVYKARQPSLDRTVALKILSPELGRDPAFAERFAREARVLGKLNHPNIVTVFEHGESGGFFYLIMEHVDGVNLRQAMRAGRFTPQQALAVVPGICDALQAAHAQGVWHRDIKPENILLDAQGGVKIVDFGIARIVGDPQRDFTLTMTGAALGSAAYMAPEQHEKPHDVDHRADIYSLGVVIYEMLTGELPLGRFKAPSTKAAVDARIDEIVFRTLEKERELRQQSADEVKTEVQGAASRKAPTRAAPSAQKSPQLRFASKAALIGGVVLFTAAVVFTYGSTQGVLLAIAVTAFVLGGLGLLVGGVASSVVSPAAAAPVTVRSLWLFLGGIVGIVAGLIILDDAPYVPVYTSAHLIQPVLMPDPSALKLGKLLIALGGVAAFAGWCGLWYALSQMKCGAIPTTLRGFARTCAWMPIVLFHASSALWVKRRDGARQAQAEAALRVEEQQRAAKMLAPVVRKPERVEKASAPPVIEAPVAAPPEPAPIPVPKEKQRGGTSAVELTLTLNRLAAAENAAEFQEYMPTMLGEHSAKSRMKNIGREIARAWTATEWEKPPRINQPAETAVMVEFRDATDPERFVSFDFIKNGADCKLKGNGNATYQASGKVSFRNGSEEEAYGILARIAKTERVLYIVGRPYEFEIIGSQENRPSKARESAHAAMDGIALMLRPEKKHTFYEVIAPPAEPKEPFFLSLPGVKQVHP